MLPLLFLVFAFCDQLSGIMFQVIDAAKSRPDVLVQVGLEYRYMPPVAKLIEVVNGGTLGQVKMVAIREHRFPFLVKVLRCYCTSLVFAKQDS